MTYKKEVPDKVFNRWKELNPEYDIEFSLDDNCIIFLKEHFNDYIVNLFKSIPEGMYKADLWRLCKLYINGGVYADIDLVPYLDIDTLDKNITFYSCLDINNNGIFQAFMVNFSKPKNPLLLVFLMSFLINKPYFLFNGPTYDMYNCIKYNLNNINIETDTKYNIDEVKININIGSSDKNTKTINLYYFPEEIKYNIRLILNPYKDTFEFKIQNNILYVERIDEKLGWGHNHSIEIYIESKESIFLFKENIGSNSNWITSYVTTNSQKILDSRDMEYYNNNKSW